jgi:transposase
VEVRILGAEQGLEGQSEPDEPANVLTPNGGHHAVLGLDVHIKATVWHLLDATGQTVETGKTPTTFPELRRLVLRLSESEEVVVGQEVGKMAYLVHDIVTAAGARILSFNAWHLRMIASSRKKTDRRDAYWIAKSLQTGMTPTPVYLPTGEVRELRALLSRRAAVVTERTRWLLRARGIALHHDYFAGGLLVHDGP